MTINEVTINEGGGRFLLLFLYAYFLVSFVSCRKEVFDVVPIPSSDSTYDCINFSSLPVRTYFSEERFQYKKPEFNPNNSNEFVCWFIDYESQIFQLIKYNLHTKNMKVLADNVKPITQPKWSVNGWVVFDHNYQIWKVKEDGDSLRQLTTETANLFPSWDASGKHIYYPHSPGLAIPYFYSKYNISNGRIDTLSKPDSEYYGSVQENDISSNNQIIANIFLGSTHYLAVSTWRR